MHPRSRDAARLWDIVDAAGAVRSYLVSVDLPTYLQNRQVRSAVERELEIIGEAARRLSIEFRVEHPEIPWSSIIAQRNVLAHEYERVENVRIWKVAAELLPQLEEVIRPLLPPSPEVDKSP